MNRGLKIFRWLTKKNWHVWQRLCLRFTKCCWWANFTSGEHSSMSSAKETPKKLAAVLEQKNLSCSGDCCRLCECLFKVQKGNKFQQISMENLFKLPGKRGVEKRPLDKLLSEDLGLHLSNNSNCS